MQLKGENGYIPSGFIHIIIFVIYFSQPKDEKALY